MTKRTVVSFSEFATYGVILGLVTKERAKYSVKNHKRKHESGGSLYLKQLKPMMPPRQLWICPPKELRPKSGKGLAAWTYERKKADARLKATIHRYRKQTPEAPWLKNLDAFIQEIQEIVSGERKFSMEKPKVVPVYKKYDAESNCHIFRPICVYSSLRTKILLALTYKYLLHVLDDMFHGNMLFMRSAVMDNEGHRRTPNFLDAIDLVARFREAHNDREIFVGECDIQKFYDIINHDVILECLDELFRLKANKSGVDAGLFSPARNVVEEYLKSYNFYDDVWRHNAGEDPFWKGCKKSLSNSEHPDSPCRFGWVSNEAFIESGCYNAEELERAKKSGLLGIPQGGALSGIIVNVIMQCIDYDIVCEHDPNRLFVRFCDDIILMHTDRKHCQSYLDTYLKNLCECKLVPHRQIAVASCKNGVRTHKDFWDAKSKNVFKWGSGSGDASDWIAFVGYEMRRTGEVRIRKDKIDEQFRHIAHKYFQIIKLPERLKAMKSSPDELKSLLEKRLTRFNELPPCMEHYVKATHDRYSIAQGRHLDKYFTMKVRRAANKLGVTTPTNLILYEKVMGSAR